MQSHFSRVDSRTRIQELPPQQAANEPGQAQDSDASAPCHVQLGRLGAGLGGASAGVGGQQMGGLAHAHGDTRGESSAPQERQDDASGGVHEPGQARNDRRVCFMWNAIIRKGRKCDRLCGCVRGTMGAWVSNTLFRNIKW